MVPVRAEAEAREKEGLPEEVREEGEDKAI